ncbi:PH domain-containing protein [Corynebacterium suedekumii]|nr:PH domain-containing protein [Corynebacterium suedekumii]
MNPVSPKLTTARYLGRLPWILLPAIGFALAAWLWSPWLWIGAGIVAALFLWQLWLIPAQVKLLGWQETEDELLITKGRLWHTFTVVPYGRIQFVDVTAGPIERSLGMKTLELHTASASSDSSVQGLPADTADALRDRLAVKARERMSGL